METLFKNFPQIIEDNEAKYYSALKGIIESIDYKASVLITRRITGVSVRILPSSTGLINPIIAEVNKLNTMFGIRVEFSKSIKNTYAINFNINI